MNHAADVVDLVVGDSACARRAAERLTAAGSWDAVLETATRWNVVGFLHAQLDATMTMQLPAGVLAQLRAESLRASLRSRSVVEHGAGVLKMLGGAGIEGIAIKGIAAICALGRAATARTTNDVDLVVRESDAAPARALLHRAGFVEIDPAFEQHMEDIALSRELHNVSRTLRKDGLEVDLHWRFGPRPPEVLDAGRLIDRGIFVAAGAARVRVANPVDSVLVNVHHALRTSFVPSAAVRDLCDLKLWWDDRRVAESLDELLEDALRSGLAPSLLAMWATVVRRDPGHGIRAGYERLSSAIGTAGRAEARLLEDHFAAVLAHGTPARFTLQVFAPGVYARSVIGGVSRALRGLRAVKSEAAPPESSVDAKRPLFVRIKDLPPRCLRVVREMTRVRSIGSYRAVARAQSRFH